MMMIPCLHDRVWSSDEFWNAVNVATDYIASYNHGSDRSEVKSRLLENVLFFSRPMGSA